VVKAGNMVRQKKPGKKFPLGENDKHYLLENCGDQRVKAKVMGKNGHFVDLMLKLHYRIPLMLVTNNDVPNGHANGTRVVLESVVLKEGVSPSKVSLDGLECPTVDTSDVDHFVCTSETVSKSDPVKMFHIKPRSMKCAIKAPLPKSIGGNVQATVNFTVGLRQLPMLVNIATTGHKLQGQTKAKLVISVWSQRKNWNYVSGTFPCADQRGSLLSAGVTMER